MTHSYRAHYFHLIWSTKGRQPQISPEIEMRLYSNLGATIKKKSGTLLEIGGMPDHIHLLIELSLLDKYSDLIRDVKAALSLWIHKNWLDLKDFGWQEGYGSYTVSYSALKHVRKYIQNQKQHHINVTFEEEYKKYLSLHDI